MFLLACLLVREVGDVQGYPYPVYGKFEGGGKMCRESINSPLPSPPPPHNLEQIVKTPPLKKSCIRYWTWRSSSPRFFFLGGGGYPDRVSDPADKQIRFTAEWVGKPKNKKRNKNTTKRSPKNASFLYRGVGGRGTNATSHTYDKMITHLPYYWVWSCKAGNECSLQPQMPNHSESHTWHTCLDNISA